jgi:peroxiredoxin
MATSSAFRATLVVSLLVATCIVVLLSLEVRGLRGELQAARDRELFLFAGQYVPVLQLSPPAGPSATIGAPPTGTSQALFIFNTTCSFCPSAVRVWNDLAVSLRERGVQAYGLSLDPAAETARFAESHGLEFPSLLVEEPRSAALLRADAVPQTFLVNSEGMVLFAYRGALSPSAVDSLLTLVDSTSSQPGGDRPFQGSLPRSHSSFHEESP